MNNQGNYQPYRARLPPPFPFQQPIPVPGPGPGPTSGTLTSSQSYMNWSQGQHMPPLVPPPRIPPPGQHFYRVPPPPLRPPPSSSHFTPVPSGSFVLPPQPPPSQPPPPPSSPPPGPPPLPPSSSPVNGNGHVNGSDVPPPPPRDEKIARKIEVLCHYIAKNGEGFEEMTRQKEVGNPEFEFLFGGAAGSEAAISHEYFKWMKRKSRSNGLLEGVNNVDLSSKPSVVGTSHQDVSHSPAGSDMDMEDDITLPEDPSVGKSLGNEKHDAAFISNEVDTKAENVECESPRAFEQGPNLSFLGTQFEKTKVKVGVADSESSLDCKTDQNNINLYQETNQSEQSPFRLIQGYASDDNSENDNDPHFENVSPVAVSPQVKEHITPSVPVVEGSLNTASKVSEPLIQTEKLENITDGATGPKSGGAQKEDSNVELEIDEFGRVLKRGDSDSDSDDYSTRRRVKRGRSRSRSRSPYDRRKRRSPQRRRENRSPSRSWSPRKRDRSRSPNNRSNKSHLQEICYDHRRGKCRRGSTCRYRHERKKSEESRRHKNQQYNHEVSDKLKDSDKSVPEKGEVGCHVSTSSDRFNEVSVEPPGHSADMASGHEMPITGHSADVASGHEMPITGHVPISGHSLNQTSQPGPQLASECNLMPPVTLWNNLPPPPPPPHPQLGRPLPHHQLNQPPFQTNYPFQPYVRPYGPGTTTHPGVYPMNYPILQPPVGPTVINQENFARTSSPNLVPSNTVPSFLQNPVVDSVSDFGRSRIMSHYNPYASTFDQPLSTKFSSGVFNQDYSASTNQNYTPGEGQTHNSAQNPPASGGDQYDPLLDSIAPSSNSIKKSTNVAASEENDEFGETADAEVGAVENDSPSPSSPVDLPDMAPGDVEIDQVKSKKSKDSRSMKLFKIALADFVKEVLKPSWRQGNMSKEAFKTIVKKTVDKVSGAMKKHQIPKSQSKINHYIDSSQRKLTKLVMGYVDKYVKV